MGQLITYHEWAEQAGYKRNKEWTRLPDARKMLRRRDTLLGKGPNITDEQKRELEAYDTYWMYAFEYGFDTIDEVIKFQISYFMAMFDETHTETREAIKKVEADEYEKLNSLSKYITGKNWKTK